MPSNISSPFRQERGPSRGHPRGGTGARRRTVSQRAADRAVALERLEGVGGAAGIEPARRGPTGRQPAVARARPRAGAGRRGSSLGLGRSCRRPARRRSRPGHRRQRGAAHRGGRRPPGGGPRRTAPAARRAGGAEPGCGRRPRPRPCRPRTPTRGGVAARPAMARATSRSAARAGPPALLAEGLERPAVGDAPELGRATSTTGGPCTAVGIVDGPRIAYAERRLRPLSRRARTTAWPARSDIRCRKPWRLARRRLFGW